MDGKSIIKRKIKRMVECLEEDNNENMELLTQFSKMKNRILRCFWILFLAVVFSTCVYQIADRINFYMSSPTTVNVYNAQLHEGDMPATILCSAGLEEIQNFTNDLRNTNVTFNVSAKFFWEMINTTNHISSAYYTMKNGSKIAASMKTKPRPQGTCTYVFNDKSLPLDDPSLKLVVKLKNKLQILRQCVDSKGIDFIAPVKICKNEALNKLQEQNVIIEKFIFLDKKQDPCLQPKEYDDCLLKCEQRFYRANQTACRYPFMDHNDGTSECWVSKQNILRAEIQQLYQNFVKYGLKACGCYRPCTSTMMYPYSDFIENEKTEIHILLQSNVVRIMKESLAYDFISLLCDIGGNLSLYLGVSCLTLAEVVVTCIGSYSYRRKIAGLTKYKLFNRVSKVYQKERCERNPLDNSHVWSKKSDTKFFTAVRMKKCVIILVVAVKLLALCLLFFRINERIAYYFTYPTTVTAALIEDDTQTSVSIAVCLPSNDVIEKMRIYAERNKIAVEKVDLIDLFREPSNFSNVEELWKAYSNIHEYSRHMRGTEIKGIPLPFPFLTPFGNCTKHPYSFLFFNTTTDDCKFKVFLYSRNADVNFKRYVVLHCGFLYLTRYGRQLLSRVNTAINPCMSSIESSKCEEDCFQRKLKEENIKCSLPFLTSYNLPSCESWESAKRTRDVYLRAYLSTDPIKDCSCRLKCEETILTPNIVTHGPCKITNQSIAQFKPDHEYIEVIRQELSFPIIKLFCDIGSNLGILLGISLMSMLQIVEAGVKLLISVKQKITRE